MDNCRHGCSLPSLLHITLLYSILYYKSSHSFCRTDGLNLELFGYKTSWLSLPTTVVVLVW